MEDQSNSQVIQYLAQSLELIENGDYEGARDVLGKAMLADPTNPDVLTYYGMAEVNLGNVDEGVAYFDRAVNVAPENPEPLIYKAEVFYSLGRYKEAGVPHPETLRNTLCQYSGERRSGIGHNYRFYHTGYPMVETAVFHPACRHSHRKCAQRSSTDC